MEKRKRKAGRIILFVFLAVLIGALVAAGLFFLQGRESETSSGPSALSSQGKTGTIQKTLSGTGTLADQDSWEVTAPTGVKVTEYLVENGQMVKTGDPVALVDRASVMEAISSLREVMGEV